MNGDGDRLAYLSDAVQVMEDGIAGRDAAIRRALDEKERVVDIVARTGLSRSRIYQIRDGVRT